MTILCLDLAWFFWMAAKSHPKLPTRVVIYGNKIVLLVLEERYPLLAKVAAKSNLIDGRVVEVYPGYLVNGKWSIHTHLPGDSCPQKDIFYVLYTWRNKNYLKRAWSLWRLVHNPAVLGIRSNTYD